MAWGLRTWDAAGNQGMDTPTWVGRFLGIIDTGGSQAGSVTDVGFATGVGWWIVLPPNALALTTGPTTSLSGNTLSWSFASSFPPTVKILYGVY